VSPIKAIAGLSDGLTFYLQDVSGGNPLTSDYTLATLVVHLATAKSSLDLESALSVGGCRVRDSPIGACSVRVSLATTQLGSCILAPQRTLFSGR
jgi:hypothetical protein